MFGKAAKSLEDLLIAVAYDNRCALTQALRERVLFRQNRPFPTPDLAQECLFAWPGMRQHEPRRQRSAVVWHVHHRPVGERRDRQPHDLLERRVIVQRAREGAAHPGHLSQPTLRVARHLAELIRVSRFSQSTAHAPTYHRSMYVSDFVE